MFGKKGLCLPPQEARLWDWTLHSTDLYSSTFASYFMGAPKHVRLLQFLKDELVRRVNKMSGNWGHLLLYLPVFWAVGFCWSCYYSSNWLWLCRLAVLSSENIPVVEGVILCLKNRGTTWRRSSLWSDVQRFVHVSSTVRVRKSMGEAAGMTTYKQAGDLVAMATNKDVCIRGKSQRSAAEGTHCRSTNK